MADPEDQGQLFILGSNKSYFGFRKSVNGAEGGRLLRERVAWGNPQAR
jgi:hypothetical protein